jgi:hypothetical protein
MWCLTLLTFLLFLHSEVLDNLPIGSAVNHILILRQHYNVVVLQLNNLPDRASAAFYIYRMEGKNVSGS